MQKSSTPRQEHLIVADRMGIQRRSRPLQSGHLEVELLINAEHGWLHAHFSGLFDLVQKLLRRRKKENAGASAFVVSSLEGPFGRTVNPDLCRTASPRAEKRIAFTRRQM